jgi:hypothetical protein
MIVLSDATAAAWVLENETMAFSRTSRSTELLAPGDRVAIYLSRGAHHNPSKNEAQILAVGTVASATQLKEVTVAGHTYSSVCSLSLDTSLPIRAGVSFVSLVPQLEFIRQKTSWGPYLRRTLVPITDADFARIRAAVTAAAQVSSKS